MKKSFTLVEIMISVGLMAVLAVGVNTYFISSLRSARKSATNVIVKSEGEMMLTNIVQDVKFAKRINTNCPTNSLSILASDGSDITYTISGGNITYLKQPPNPTPMISMNLNSTKTAVNGCGGNVFSSCIPGGKVVDVCFIVNSTGAGDVTDTTSMTFKNFIYTAN